MPHGQGSQSHTGGCTSLINGTIYFGTSQYQYIVSGLHIIYIYIYIIGLFGGPVGFALRLQFHSWFPWFLFEGR